uniref:Uncharacterized protein n=1 Tax=Anguilla anguilla TaxID=7936 RepID=A0A0E9SBX3_ANGAN
MNPNILLHNQIINQWGKSWNVFGLAKSVI